MRTRLVEPSTDQMLAYCAEEPVERVFLEDVARRGTGRFAALEREDGSLQALCHLGTQRRPVRRGLRAASPSWRRERRPRMLIGERGAVGDLWSALATEARPRRGRTGPAARVRLDEPPEPGGTGLRPATPTDLDLLVPACARGPPGGARRRPAQARRQRLPLAHARPDRGGPLVALGRGRRDPLQGGGVGVDADRRAAAAGLGRPARPPPRQRDAGRCATSSSGCSADVPAVCLFVRAENDAAIRLYETVGMRHVLDYRSVLL